MNAAGYQSLMFFDMEITECERGGLYDSSRFSAGIVTANDGNSLALASPKSALNR